MTLEEAKKIIKSECYIADLLDFDRTQMVNAALDTVIEAAEETRWIPVNERLPEEWKRVLVSDTWCGVYVGQYIDTEEAWGGKHFINEGGMHSKTVTAWQPLPQPYKAEGSDEE